MPPPARRCAVLLAAALLSACGKTYSPEQVALDDAALESATAVLREAASRRGDIRPVEGGFVVDAYYWEWRDRYDWDVMDPTRIGEYPGPRPLVEQERVLAGPRSVYLTPEKLTSVRILTYALGGALVEIGMEDEAQVALLETDDVAEAEALALAIDVLRRAAHPDGASAPPP